MKILVRFNMPSLTPDNSVKSTKIQQRNVMGPVGSVLLTFHFHSNQQDTRYMHSVAPASGLVERSGRTPTWMID